MSEPWTQASLIFLNALVIGVGFILRRVVKKFDAQSAALDSLAKKQAGLLMLLADDTQFISKHRHGIRTLLETKEDA